MQNITLRHVTSLPVPRFTHLPSELGACLFTFIADFCVASLVETS